VGNPSEFMMDLLNQSMRLRDGRTLGFAEHGVEEGAPIIYFHGWPSSRLEPCAMRQVCIEMGFRMIAPDRPGFGLSDFHPGRRLLDFTDDVLQLADHLHLKRFVVLGISGGGPYAAACAARLAERLSAALLVCSMGPADAPDATKGMVAVNRWLLATARHYPRLAERIAGFCLWAIWGKGQQALPKQIEAQLPPSDRKALASEELRQCLTASSVEALRGGTRAAAADGLLYGRPWGFSLSEIRAPVFLWHGERDVIVPPSMGHYLAAAIPGCVAQFPLDDGHFSLPFTRLREILATVQRPGDGTLPSRNH
jgi:pimeloyl-ACP methyl ester carboxylesterase